MGRAILVGYFANQDKARKAFGELAWRSANPGREKLFPARIFEHARHQAGEDQRKCTSASG
jgi:hypothetical protein